LNKNINPDYHWKQEQTVTGINEVWIINDAGMCIFHEARDKNCNSDIISGYFAAIDMIIQSQGTKSIGKMSLGKQRLLFHKSEPYGLLFIGKGDNKEKETMLENSLKSIVGLFQTNFTAQDIKTWKGNLNAFSMFKDKIKELFETREERMQNFFN
jgi:hypothetical protein